MIPMRTSSVRVDRPDGRKPRAANYREKWVTLRDTKLLERRGLTVINCSCPFHSAEPRSFPKLLAVFIG